MTTIQKGDFVFSVETEKTREYYKTNSVCECCDCKNLYKQIKDYSAELNAFLSEYGVDICRPDEVSSIETNGFIDYLFIGYTVTGTIDTDGVYNTNIGNIKIQISKGDTVWDWFPNEQTQPCFFISVSGLKLPWVLDTPYPKETGLFDKIKCFFNGKG